MVGDSYVNRRAGAAALPPPVSTGSGSKGAISTCRHGHANLRNLNPQSQSAICNSKVPLAALRTITGYGLAGFGLRTDTLCATRSPSTTTTEPDPRRPPHAPRGRGHGAARRGEDDAGPPGAGRRRPRHPAAAPSCGGSRDCPPHCRRARLDARAGGRLAHPLRAPVQPAYQLAGRHGRDSDGPAATGSAALGLPHGGARRVPRTQHPRGPRPGPRPAGLARAGRPEDRGDVGDARCRPRRGVSRELPGNRCGGAHAPAGGRVRTRPPG